MILMVSKRLAWCTGSWYDNVLCFGKQMYGCMSRKLMRFWRKLRRSKDFVHPSAKKDMWWRSKRAYFETHPNIRKAPDINSVCCLLSSSFQEIDLLLWSSCWDSDGRVSPTSTDAHLFRSLLNISSTPTKNISTCLFLFISFSRPSIFDLFSSSSFSKSSVTSNEGHRSAFAPSFASPGLPIIFIANLCFLPKRLRRPIEVVIGSDLLASLRPEEDKGLGPLRGPKYGTRRPGLGEAELWVQQTESSGTEVALSSSSSGCAWASVEQGVMGGSGWLDVTWLGGGFQDKSPLGFASIGRGLFVRTGRGLVAHADIGKGIGLRSGWMARRHLWTTYFRIWVPFLLACWSTRLGRSWQVSFGILRRFVEQVWEFVKQGTCKCVEGTW